jgi:hypothetical protein
MCHSKAQKAKTHERIAAVASEKFDDITAPTVLPQ